METMWEQIKRWFGGQSGPAPEQESAQRQYRWYELGDENPFGVRFLDVRGLTWNVVSATEDYRIADSFGAQRRSDGREFVSAPIENAGRIACNLTFPHNGAPLSGIVFKADSMDVKWDIYVYDSVFLFVRSWTGKLKYRAVATIGQQEIRIRSIEASVNDLEDSPQAVYFILATHAMNRVLPHKIPSLREFPAEDYHIIAAVSFNMYGRFACYATDEDITQIPVPRPQL